LERPTWAPGEIDLERPSVARVYDYYLGGSHNFAVDRQMAQRAIALMPDLPMIMQANRAFLRRAVRYLLGVGITQFLDIGSGIPTAGNVHDVVHETHPHAPVVYVDTDPVAVAHSRAILHGNDRATVIQADLREPEVLLASPGLRSLLDLDQPVGVLMVAVLHFVTEEDDPAAVVGRLYDAVAPGSYLALTHASHDGDQQNSGAVEALYARSPTPITMRSREQVVELFKGFSLVDPGVVFLPSWHPDTQSRPDDHQAARFSGYAGVGRKT
jgi:SAM-dependent methyltransferase